MRSDIRLLSQEPDFRLLSQETVFKGCFYKQLLMTKKANPSIHVYFVRIGLHYGVLAFRQGSE